MYKFLKYILFAGFVFMFLTAFNQETQYLFKQIGMGVGLPGQNIRQVYQDKNGIIWLSVEAIGVSRYNGRSFELFSNSLKDPNSLSSNYVNLILEDKDENLWIATEKGLNKYNRNKNNFKQYLSDTAYSNGLTTNLMLSLNVDDEGQLWVGTGKGLFRYIKETDSFEKVNLLKNESHLWVNTIYQHSSGDLFLGTNKGVIQYNPKGNKYTHWQEQRISGNGPIDRVIRNFIEDRFGNLWVATHRGLNIFNYKTKKFELWEFKNKDKSIFKSEGFNHLYSKDKNTIWAASYTSGIVVINAETRDYQRVSTKYNSEGTLKSDHIRQIFNDRSDLLWISTKFEGVFIYDRKKEMFSALPEKYSVFSPLKNMHVLAFNKDIKEGCYWVGTKYNGLYYVNTNNNTLENFKNEINNQNTVGSNRIQSVFCDSKGNVWVGLTSGFDHFNYNTKKFTHYYKTLVEKIAEDINGNIWVASTEGIFIANKEKQRLERYTKNQDPVFKNDGLHINSLYIDKKGQVWFGTRFNGAYVLNFEKNKVIHYSTRSNKYKLKGNAIRDIKEDLQGNTIMGTKSDGLCLINQHNNTVKYLTTDDALPSNFILSIQPDLQGNLWLGTHNGLSKYNADNNNFNNYSIVHGLQGNIFELGVSGIFNDGYLIFGGHNGLNIFNPKLINTNQTGNRDSILITNVKANNVEILRDIYQNTTIELNHKEKILTIEFVLSNYADPLNHTFKYRMLENSTEWYQLGNKNHLTYTNLKSGNYHLQISGTNEYGIECSKPVELILRIKPPIHKTLLFKVLLFLIISLISISIIYYRIATNKRIRKKLELEINERTQRLRAVNNSLIEKNTLIQLQKKEIVKNSELLETKVSERTKDLEIAKIKAEEADKLKSSFLANMSHEIRTPLNSILGFSAIIAETSENKEDFVDHINCMNKSSETLLKIIGDVLDISKIESGQFEINKSSFDIVDLLYKIYCNYLEIIKEENPNVQLYIIKPVPKKAKFIIYTDHERLHQIFENLLNNALKFTETGFIELGFEIEPDCIKFYVRDTGIGISESDQKNIFNRFFKLENDSNVYRGNGLGLSLCKSLAHILGGNIYVDSKLNKGSTFYFTIPAEGSHILQTKNEDPDN